MRTPVVGFDLDMTLVDSAAGIAATVRATAAEHGLDVPEQQVWALIGVPLEAIFAQLTPTLDPATAADRYRALYPELGVPATTVLPGAREALDAVRSVGGRAVVISTKVERAVRLVVDALGLDVDGVAGGMFAEAKGDHLRTLGALAYVGDHPGDVRAAHRAGATAVAVATGPHSADDLREAGADVVLADLTAFPTWLAHSVNVR